MINYNDNIPGLYGSVIGRNKAVGFCKRHGAAMTVKTMKRHECLGKQCNAFVRYDNHDFWRQHDQAKKLRAERKKRLSD